MRRQYTIYVEEDQFPDPERYADSTAWRSGVLDEKGKEIDGEGDLPTYEDARDLAMTCLSRMLENTGD